MYNPNRHDSDSKDEENNNKPSSSRGEKRNLESSDSTPNPDQDLELLPDLELLIPNRPSGSLSPITFLRIGAPDPAYSHILSFRRQVYISLPEDNFQIPEVLEIYHDDLTYHIYLTTDTLCYKCKQPGHLASRCASLQLQAPTSPYTKSQQQSSSPDNPSHSNNST
uniref:Uncharacterized protein LOC114342124 n=1 Tax=Diabrotica virgifera virgifera TaxID=50390 RepID=A0A6P7GY50_DIAVI